MDVFNMIVSNIPGLMTFHPVSIIMQRSETRGKSTMSVIEQEIHDRVQQLSEDQKQLVLEYVRHLDMTDTVSKLSARDLLQLPPAERQRILAASLALAAEEDFEYFEAYDEGHHT
jgi:hypothetical protein